MLGRIPAPTDVFTITRSTEDCRPVPQVELRFEIHSFYICRIIETENVGAIYILHVLVPFCLVSN